jgi:hypothetical protein
VTFDDSIADLNAARAVGVSSDLVDDGYTAQPAAKAMASAFTENPALTPESLDGGSPFR